jgi:mannonate dehydratase
MQRREFLQTAAVAALPLAAGASNAEPSSAGRMKVGHQHSDSEEVLKVLSALGVNHICSAEPSRTLDEKWSVEGLTRLRERVESHGITLDAVPLPLSSSYISKAENPNIMLGKSPERDREIDNICQMIRNAARAGIPMLKYNMTILGVVRSESTPGRGASQYSTFVYEKAVHEGQNQTLTPAGNVSAEQMWERITYFLNRVIPTAAENKIKMACHPHDPGMPEPQGFRGVHRVLGSVAGLKRFVAINENPYHGLNFCQGTVSEMLQNPKVEIFNVIRHFAGQRKIFNVHFRNIQGRFGDFRETLPDNGDIDFVKAIRTYKEAGYSGMLMPDHVPKIEGDTNGAQAFAYCFGYIQALIQTVYSS